ncbi:hypothetical protein F4553_000494 [Allocatelliglobosispora scoriae]|uniref:Uncharacterized protein n=1 Tax=Allocatelliglobosispora scoriae TaxID=643052 RepID=A0A841BHL4_9ACTN|nr:hypothetical protein [Allocatelliglobosispora scoriae]MBB5867115.1 hypothetical protein [Allocatelliglobosispora scoriae]
MTVSTDSFEQDKREMMASGTPSDGDNLDGMMIDFDHYLVFKCRALGKGTVAATGDPARLLLVTCAAASGASPEEIAAEISGAWRSYLRYGFREAHRIRDTPTTVELDFATQSGEGGIFVTGTVVVRL